MTYSKTIEDNLINSINTVLENNISSYKEKSDRSIVTDIDVQVSESIYNFMTKILKEDINYISEEGLHLSNTSKHTIVVDPIDGTENFVSGLPFYGVSICHYINEKHTYSLLYFPALNKSISSLDDKIAKSDFKSRIITLSSGLGIEEIKTFLEDKKEYKEYRIFGSAVYNIYSVITGTACAYHSPSINTWDMLAGINLALQNGKKVVIDGKNYNGRFLPGNKKYSLTVS